MCLALGLSSLLTSPLQGQNRYGAAGAASFEVNALRRDLDATTGRVARLENEIQSLRGMVSTRGGQVSYDRGSTPPPSNYSAADGAVHRVQRGETLSSIARRYQVGVDRIVSANQITNPNALRVGQEIVIPGRKGSAAIPSSPPQDRTRPSPASGASYTVRGGDTLSSIARRHGVTTTSIIQANAISNPHALRVGQTLIIPGSSASAPAPSYGERSGSQRPPAPAPDPRRGRNDEVVAPPGHGFYQIERGDTLHSIAISFGTNTAELRRLNGMPKGASLHVGDFLLVPVPDESLYES